MRALLSWWAAVGVGVVGVLLLAGNSSTLPVKTWRDLTLTTRFWVVRGKCSWAGLVQGSDGAGYAPWAVRGGRARLRRVAVDASGAQVSLCQPPSAFPIAGVIIALEAFHTAAQKTRLQPVPLKG